MIKLALIVQVVLDQTHGATSVPSIAAISLLSARFGPQTCKLLRLGSARPGRDSGSWFLRSEISHGSGLLGTLDRNEISHGWVRYMYHSLANILRYDVFVGQ